MKQSYEIIHNAIGSLTQLAATGPQDVHIHEDAQSFQFQSTYNTHTRFANDHCVKSNFQVKYGGKLQVEIPHMKQHLVSNLYLRVILPDICDSYNQQTCTGISYKDKLGYRLIKKVSFKIENQIIESYSGQFLYILHQLETSSSHKDGLEAMMQTSTCNTLCDGSKKTLYIPIPLWYARSMKQFFPIIALHKQKVLLEIEFETIENLVVCEDNNHVISVDLGVLQNGKVKLTCVTDNGIDPNLKNIIMDAELQIDYIFLNDIERDAFLTNKQEHIYNFVQYQNEVIRSNNAKIDLHFNIPVKQIIFILTDANDDFTFYSFDTARFMFDQDSMNTYPAHFFETLQNHFRNFANPIYENIFSYSFALNAGITEHNGAIHFGKLKRKYLEVSGALTAIRNAKNDDNINSLEIHIYARGYNVLHTNKGTGKIQLTNG